jgi:hypothetical protein
MVLGSGKPGWYRRQSVRVKTLLAVGTATAGFIALGLSAAVPASADPGSIYIGGGSDTTQAIMDAFATTTGGLVASYDAVDPVTQTVHTMVNAELNAGTSQTLETFLRPNGSGDGFTALRYSNGTNLAALSPYGGGTTAQMPAVGSLAFSRSSGGPASVAGSANVSATGQYQFVPFAYDNVAVSVGPSTLITNANLFTFTDLVNLYKNCATVTENGVTYWPFSATGTQPPNTTRIDLYVPQSGSGSRNFWLDEFTGQHSTLPSCVFDTEQQGPNVGKSLEENNGQIVSDDTSGIFPYSVGQWIFQKNAGGAKDLRDGAVLTNNNAISPCTTALPTCNAQNVTTFPIFRELFNVLIVSKITGASADPNLVSLFVGANSALCGNGGIIRSFGFVPLSATTQAPDPCGSTATSLRADANG